ncbi:MAG: uracil-DNA glycosylase family protein, partial [Candidatus Bathyarchaeia archaeon]
MKNRVLGEGDLDSRVVFVGEAPGRREDESGRPFVGSAGKLLDRILT